MRLKVSIYFMDGRHVKTFQIMSEQLYYLVDENGWYRSVIFICGQPWVTKNMQEKDATRYTFSEMLNAREYFRRRRIKVQEHEVPGERKFDKFGKRLKEKEKI
jgi:hypothetical protein